MELVLKLKAVLEQLQLILLVELINGITLVLFIVKLLLLLLVLVVVLVLVEIK